MNSSMLRKSARLTLNLIRHLLRKKTTMKLKFYARKNRVSRFVTSIIKALKLAPM